MEALSKKQKLGRLMMRAEGVWWNAYFGNESQDAIHLGSIRLSLVVGEENRVAKDAFLKIFRDNVAKHIRNITGQCPDMITTVAPESERSGSA